MTSHFIKGLTIVLLFIVASTFAGSAGEPDETTAVKPARQGFTANTNSVADIDPNMTFSLIPQEVRVNLTNEFAIDIAVENTTDMYGWQICLCYDPTQLELVNVSLPFNHVFSTAYTVCNALDDYYPSEFPCPLQWRASANNARESFVYAGNCLLGSNQSTFNGSGILCRIEFRAIDPGSSTLRLMNNLEQSSGTFVLNHAINDKTAPSECICNVSVES